MLFLSLSPTLFLVQSRSHSGRHVSTGFFGSYFGSHEAGWLAFDALQGPRPARGTRGRVWEARPDGESTLARPSLVRGMEAASEKKRTPQHEGVTEGRRGKTAENPLLPYNVPHTPLGIRRAACFLLLCISQTPEMHPRPFLASSGPSQGFSSICRGSRRLADMWIKMAAFPDLTLRRCCLG